MAATPYVSAAAFRAHPTYLDTEGLNLASDDPDAQTAELTNLLLAASDWCDSELDQPLGAHLYTQRERVFCGSDGQLKFHSDHGPVIQVTELGYGYTPTALTTLTDPTVWVEQDTNIVFSFATNGTVAWSGSLQFGTPGLGGDMFVQSTVVAGHVATVLDDDASDGDSTLTVLDPTGITPGARYRIWEPGVEENVVVDPAWTPPTPSTIPMPTAVSLLQPLRHAHTAGSDFSGMPADLRKAVVLHTVSQLLRPDTTAEDEYPDNATSSTRSDDSRTRGMGLLKEARRTLASYARVR
ncbi:hypothetical protein JYK17_17440 [Streptomyces sp. KC 17012]|uniref:hypothetical protein n=1 Tax=Streptomyces plumbidurans TaxID=2814589 RepID=UPI001C9D85D5|nr:hypothetical protein [Streptomyces plumbidurans]MBY8341816.1 hypothetical protein [Streptomyces plumbidurans]